MPVPVIQGWEPEERAQVAAPVAGELLEQVAGRQAQAGGERERSAQAAAPQVQVVRARVVPVPVGEAPGQVVE